MSSIALRVYFSASFKLLKLVSKFPEFMFSAGGLAVGFSAMQRGSGASEGDILPPGAT